MEAIKLWWRRKFNSIAYQKKDQFRTLTSSLHTAITPNPAKVLIILEELRIPYVGIYVELSELKEPAYESVNPNGRVPGES